MQSFATYRRALSFLRARRRAAAALCAANLALAGIGFAEPVLFGRVIQGLGGDGPSSANLLIWAGLGVLGVVAGMATSLVADRLAHRLHLPDGADGQGLVLHHGLGHAHGHRGRCLAGIGLLVLGHRCAMGPKHESGRAAGKEDAASDPASRGQDRHG